MTRKGESSRSGEGAGSKRVKLAFPQRLERHVLRRILSGFLVLIPLIATVLIVRYAFVYVDGIFRGDGGFLTPLLEGTPLYFPGVGVVFALVILYLVGVLITARLGRKALDWQAAIITRIPVVKSIYGVAKQATDAITDPMGRQFNRVVFLEWPRRGCMALGFVTGYCESPKDGSSPVLVVYVPTVPNPTSGNLAFVPEEEVVETELTVEDAMKLVFSGGMVLPDCIRLRGKRTASQLPGDSSTALGSP